MSDKVLIKEFKEHIKGYGFIVPNYGIPYEEFAKYSKVWEEFEVDESLPKHCVGEKIPSWNDIPYIEIPRGTLKVWGIPLKGVDDD
jgi:hypothetical protein